jgi:hypothetical protein
MKLYMYPVSTATRPVRLLITENGIKCDEEMVDILKGTHYQEPYSVAALSSAASIPGPVFQMTAFRTPFQVPVVQ